MIDVFASEIHFAHHLAPIWHALPDELRGQFVVGRLIRDRVRVFVPEATTVPTVPDRPVLVASWGDLRRAAESRRTRIAYLEHGAGQSYGGTVAGYSGGRSAHHPLVGLYLVPNETSAARWRAAWPDARVEVVGCPKVEGLPRRPADAPLEVAFSSHWECEVAPETRSAFPHFRSALPALAARFPVIGHGHPRALDQPPNLRRWYARMHIELVEDFAEVCRRAAVYVCDNSSTLYEFAATGRPVVVLDAPWYRREVEHGLRFWDAADVGVRISDPGDLVDAVAVALADPPEVRERRERIIRRVYPVIEGAARLAADALASWVAPRRAVRAA